MTTTPIAFTNDGADLVADADILKLHPDMTNNRWRGSESYRAAFVEAFDKVAFDLANIGLKIAYIYTTTRNLDWFSRVVMYQALIMIFRDFRAERGDRWDMLIGDYQAQYDLALTDPTLDYDTAAESAATEDTTIKTGEIRLIR
jgi:hypothetical protein